MPAPVTIRDPEPTRSRGPASNHDPNPIVPLRNFVSTGLPTRPGTGDGVSKGDRPVAGSGEYMNDISVSPRLLGYVFSCISSAVSMISSSVFFAREATPADPESIEKYSESRGNLFPIDKVNAISIPFIAQLWYPSVLPLCARPVANDRSES